MFARAFHTAPQQLFTPVSVRRRVAGMKQTLLILALAIGQSVLAADVVIDDPSVRDALAKMFRNQNPYQSITERRSR